MKLCLILGIVWSLVNCVVACPGSCLSSQLWLTYEGLHSGSLVWRLLGHQSMPFSTPLPLFPFYVQLTSSGQSLSFSWWLFTLCVMVAAVANANYPLMHLFIASKPEKLSTELQFQCWWTSNEKEEWLFSWRLVTKMHYNRGTEHIGQIQHIYSEHSRSPECTLALNCIVHTFWNTFLCAFLEYRPWVCSLDTRCKK